MCMVLPAVIKSVVEELGDSLIPNDTVMEELRENAKEQNIESYDLAVAMAIYILGFGTYKGFTNRE